MLYETWEIHRLWSQIHGWHAARAPDRYHAVSQPTFESWYAWAIKEHEFLTERIDGVLRGYAAIRMVESPGNALVKGRKYAFVDQIVVDADFQRCGVGERLIRQVEEFCQRHRVRQIDLVCRCENPAIGFFSAMGFIPVSTLMSLSLEEG